jgi:hypothetical protein
VSGSAPAFVERSGLALESSHLDLRTLDGSEKCSGMTTYSRVCVECGEPFEASYKTKKCCTRSCAARHAAKQNHAPRTKPRTPWQERFWRYVTPGQPDECWEWQGSRDHHGYGRLNSGGKHGFILKAHRAAYELEHGPFDPELDVCHTCDNPPCCNPAHLFLGDAAANARDMASKGRAAAQRGHSNGREKLPAATIREIRERADAGARHVDLARAYGVRGSYIATVVYGQRRRRAGGPIKQPPRRDA